jgi:hypothetical protein
MDISQFTKDAITGEYSAEVQVENVTVLVKGSFDVPDPGSDSALALALELAIKQQIGITILATKRDAQAVDYVIEQEFK